MTETTNLKLKKPNDGDAVDIDIINENMDKLDAGVLPVIEANSAEYDMDVILKSGASSAFYITGSNTLGTPRAYGITTFSSAGILSYATSTTYGFQVAFVSGASTFYVRYNKNGAIGAWCRVYNEGYKPKAADVGITAGTTDIGAGSGLASGAYYNVYE